MDLSTKNILTEKETSQWFGISASYLQKGRMKGSGPAFSRVGTRIYYKRADLEAFFAGNQFTSTAQYETAYKRKAASAKSN